jgi:hypothetical protein
VPWQIARTYLRGNEDAWNWCKERKRPLAVLFSPPSGNIWSIGDVSPAPQDYDGFVAWAIKTHVVDADQVKQQTDADIDWYPFPDREELYHLKWFAEQVKTDVAYYAHETFGGATEYEFAFQFGERERVLISASDTPVQRCVEIDASGKRIIEGDLLILVMKSLGFEMTEPYFLPHTRGFDYASKIVRW